MALEFSRFFNIANLAAKCEQEAKTKSLGVPQQQKLLKLAAIYRDMASRETKPPVFADDCTFTVVGTVAESGSLKRAAKSQVPEQQEALPLAGGSGMKPPRPIVLRRS